MPLVIIGAGGFGRELADTVASINAERPTYELLGFADDNEAHHHTSINGSKVNGGRDALKSVQLLGLGQPEDVGHVTAFLLSEASRFLTGELFRWTAVVRAITFYEYAVTFLTFKKGAGLMAHGVLKDCRITGLACAVPRKKKRPEDYTDVVGKDAVEKFIATVGVREWRVCEGGMMTSDLCCAAADKLLTERGVDRSSVDGLIFVSQTPDYVAPSTACVLQHRLGLGQDCMAFDVNLACSGYVYGLVNAMAHMQGQGLKKVLLLAGDTVSYHCSPQDRGLMMLAGDAGTATLIESSPGAPDVNYILNTIGSGFKNLIVPCGGYKHRFGDQARTEREPGVIRSDYDGYMDGAEVFKFSIMEVPKLFRRFYELHGCNETSFDRLFLHQANFFIMKNIVKRLKIAPDKMAVSIDRYANTGAATIPLTMCDYYSQHPKVDTPRLERTALAGFGIGLSLGVVSLSIDPAVCLPIFETDLTFDDQINTLHQTTRSFVNMGD